MSHSLPCLLRDYDSVSLIITDQLKWFIIDGGAKNMSFRLISIFTFIYGLRRLIPIIQPKQIVKLVWSLWFIKKKYNTKGDLFWTVWITKTFDSYVVTRPGGRQEELLMGPPLKAGEWWPPWVGDGGINSLFVIPVSARWALLSLKTDYKISSFHPEIPGFDPGTFGVESWRTSDELPSSSV